jgi:Phage tail tube protein
MALTSTRYTAVGVSDTESSYGNATSRDRWFKVLSVSGLQEVVEYMPVATLHQGVGPGLAHSHKGNASVSGQIVVPFVYSGIGRLLKFCLGAAPSSSGSGPYTHTYNMGATIHSFTMELVRGNSGLSEIFLGCVVTAWELNVEQGQIVSMHRLRETQPPHRVSPPSTRRTSRMVVV